MLIQTLIPLALYKDFTGIVFLGATRPKFGLK